MHNFRHINPGPQVICGKPTVFLPGIMHSDNSFNYSTGQTRSEALEEGLKIKYNTIISNEVNHLFPNEYDPASGGTYITRLLQNWVGCLRMLYEITGYADEFSIGVLISTTSEARLNINFPVGKTSVDTVYFINPANIRHHDSLKQWQYRDRFDLRTDQNKILVIAAHEFTHGIGYYDHDSEYANAFTDLMVLVMEQRKKFDQCFFNH